jgi:hypothetical protein
LGSQRVITRNSTRTKNSGLLSLRSYFSPLFFAR